MHSILPTFRCNATKVLPPPRTFAPTSLGRRITTTSRMAEKPVLNSENISRIHDAEREMTGSDEPVAGGPTAAAQSNAGKPINSQTLSEITSGEKVVSGGNRVAGGPTATAQSILSKGHPDTSQDSSASVLDSETISKIHKAEQSISGSNDPMKGGPTATAQSHAGETINGQTLQDITKSEKALTGGERVKGGPTAIAQSKLSKAR